MLTVYVLYSMLHFSLTLSTVVGFFIAATSNFFWNKIWTFAGVNTGTRVKRQYIKFLIVSLIGLVLSVILMHIFVYYAGINVVISKLLVSGVILSWNFLANKFWTFSRRLMLTYSPSGARYTEDITILIPAYNERGRIGNTIEKIMDWQKKNSRLKTELIIVDDGSDDGTFDLVREKFAPVQIYRIPKNIGKGGAIAHGIEKAR